MPKSGSTFVTNVIAHVAGYRKTQLLSNGENQDLDPTLTAAARGLGVVAHMHVPGSQMALRLIKENKIACIVLERNLADAIVSFRDFIESAEIRRAVDTQGFLNTSHNVIIDQSFYERSKSEQLDFLIDFAVPWYLRFHVSWRKYRERDDVPIFSTTYEEVFAEPAKGIAKMLKFAGMNVSPSTITAAIQAVGRSARFNVGVAGRGASVLSESQIAKIEHMAGQYDADEAIRTPIGHLSTALRK
jgi:hypothetical protein